MKVIFFVFVLVSGVFLRLYNLGKESFWYDEIYSIELASYPFKEIISGKIADPGNPPLFFAILSLWLKKFTPTEFFSRLPVALVSIATIPVIFLIAKTIDKSRIFRLLSVSLFSVSLFSIAYAQETRSYSLLVFLVSVSLWLQALLVIANYKKKRV